MSVVIRLKVPIEMHYTVIPMGTSKVNSSPSHLLNYIAPKCYICPALLYQLVPNFMHALKEYANFDTNIIYEKIKVIPTFC